MKSQNSQPLITIIVAVFNGARTLQQCIDSVARQTYANREFIVIDGGSDDGSVDMLKANNDQIDYWISEPDTGIYDAWNKGLSQAKGDWICFLGADDYFWDAQVLERIVGLLVKLPPEIKVAYSQVMLVDSDRRSLFAIGEPWENIKSRFKQIMSIPHPGSMHRNSLFQQRGRFDNSFQIAADYELLLRELKTDDACFMPDFIAVGMMQGGISSDPANSFMAMREMRRAQKMHGQRLPGWIWLSAMAKVYVKFLLWRLLGKGFAGNLLNFRRNLNSRASDR